MSDHVIHVESNEEFTKAIKNGVVLVDFYADRCGPCRMVGPVMEELGEEYAGKATIVKVDVDEFQDISQQYKVRSIPTVVAIKNGEMSGEPMVGAFPKEQYADVLDSLIDGGGEE